MIHDSFNTFFWMLHSISAAFVNSLWMLRELSLLIE